MSDDANKQPDKQGGRPADEVAHTRKTLFGTFFSANPEDPKLAYRAAGYQAGNAKSEAAAISRLLKDPVVQEAIRAQALRPSIATRQERQEFWTKLLRGQIPGATVGDRIRGSELLGKSQGDFVERVEVVGRAEAVAHVRSLLGLGPADSKSASTPGSSGPTRPGSRD